MGRAVLQDVYLYWTTLLSGARPSTLTARERRTGPVELPESVGPVVGTTAHAPEAGLGGPLRIRLQKRQKVSQAALVSVETPGCVEPAAPPAHDGEERGGADRLSRTSHPSALSPTRPPDAGRNSSTTRAPTPGASAPASVVSASPSSSCRCSASLASSKALTTRALVSALRSARTDFAIPHVGNIEDSGRMFPGPLPCEIGRRPLRPDGHDLMRVRFDWFAVHEHDTYPAVRAVPVAATSQSRLRGLKSRLLENGNAPAKGGNG